MKKFFIILFSMILAVTLVLPAVAFADSTLDNGGAVAAADLDSISVLDILTDFITACPDRTCGTEAELFAANYLQNILSEEGYSTELQSFQYRNESEDALQTSQNLVAVKNAAEDTTLQVIIGAHYDNCTNIDVGGGAIGGDGTGDNGTGVATLFKVAAALADVSLDYNIKFILFGAEELGLYGSRKYVAAMTAEEKASTLLMINFDHVGIGDDLYLYADEVETGHADYFTAIAESNSLEVSVPPTNRNIILGYLAFDDFDLFPYMHVGLMSDNAVFMNEGINTINFLSADWDNHYSMEQSESSEFDNVLNTSEDTFENFLKNYSESGVKQMNTAANLTVNALTGEGFVSAMEDSYKNKTDYSFYTSGEGRIIVLVIVLLFAVIGFALYYKKLETIQKNSKKIEDTTPKEKLKVFEDL